MALPREELLTQLRTLVHAANGDDVQVIKQEFDDLYPVPAANAQAANAPAANAQAANVDPNQTADLTDVLKNLKISQTVKMPKLQKGDNFARFCERFTEYVTLSKIKEDNLHTLFLQNVDDKTYSILKTVELTPAQKASADEFCPLYKTAIYGDVSFSLRNELYDCKQSSDETISDYVYRLREKAQIAYADGLAAEENCLLAFVRGIRNPVFKRKLNEADLFTFKEAIALAKRLEKVDELFE